MNANSAGPSGSHLDLAELIAEANGQPAGAAAREHLAGCEECRLEASRWTLVADGVRSLAAAVPETAGAAPARPESSAPERRTRSSAAPESVTATPVAVPLEPRRRRRARLVASAAAGLVLVGGAVYGVAASNLVHVHIAPNSNAASGPAGPALTAVSGCSRLVEADGTLVQASGDHLVLTTASGQRVTVTTTASTFMAAIGALRADITDGASVTVGGPRAAGTITALLVSVGDLANTHPQLPSSDVIVRGTVADAGSSGFTVVTAAGARVPVATTAETAISVVNAGVGRLPVGGTVYALGQAGPGGTLTARAVAVIAQLPAGGPQLHAHLSARVGDCSPASVNREVMALADGG